MSRLFNCTVVCRRRAFVFSSPAPAAGAPALPDALYRRDTYFFTYGLPAASSRCLAIVRKRPLVSVRCSVPPYASAIHAPAAAGESSASRLKHCRTARRKAKPTPMALGCSIGCATKKVSKKVAGNAIFRSRLPSERKIVHSRVCSLYPLNEWEKRYLIVRFLLTRFDRIADFCPTWEPYSGGVGPVGEIAALFDSGKDTLTLEITSDGRYFFSILAISSFRRWTKSSGVRLDPTRRPSSSPLLSRISMVG